MEFRMKKRGTTSPECIIRMVAILVDIGGTHARFASLENGVIVNPQRLPVADFSSFEAALQSYRKDPCDLLIATAAHPDEKSIWRFVNNNKWIIDPEALRKTGWGIKTIINDFAGSAWGALADDRLVVLREGRADPKSPRAIIGPGTGLGLAYMIPLSGGTWHVQQTMGAHMAAAALTDEQRGIMNLMRGLYGGNHAVTYEDVASGRALPVLHRAVCAQNGSQPTFTDAKGLLLNAGDADVKQTLRLFHEFLGLFAHNIVVTGHAYGGLYVDGGITHRLDEAGLFDFPTFAKFMAPAVTSVVRERLETTPVYLINKPFAALRGLAEIAKNGA